MALTLLAACSSKPSTEVPTTAPTTETTAEEVKSDEEIFIIGKWVYNVKNKKHPFEGIAIEEGGTAKSINQSEVIYEQWRMGEGAITLSTYISSEKKREKTNYQIVTLTNDSLVLDDRKGNVITYYKLGK